MKKILFALMLGAFSFGTEGATSCGVSDARIIDVFQYFDGQIFVSFDKQTGCDCPQKSRMAFSANDPDTKFIQSMVLMAYSTGRKVNAITDIEGCPVHSNSPQMNYLRVHPTN